MPFALFFIILTILSPRAIAAESLRVVALGDSLTSGYGLEAGEDFATKLEQALIADGVNIKVENAGVSGDTSAGGLARLDWAIQGDIKPHLVIIALGGNDMLRALDPSVTKKNIAAILEKLKARDIPVLLVGMKSPTNLGPLFRGRFDRIYPELAKEYDVSFYPFFLEGVAMNAELNLADGIHPNEKGIAVMVKNLVPVVKKSFDQ